MCRIDFKMKLILTVFILCAHSVCSENVKRFLSNTNFGTPNNWKEGHVPCPGSEIIFPKKTPKVFLDGVGKTFHLSKIILPENGELILDNSMTLIGATFANEDHDCHSLESHYSKETPDFWYDPHNWCSAANISSQCLEKSQIEASIVPSAADFVVFPPQNSIFVGVKQSEPKILARKIYYRNQIYTNSIPFRLKIQRTSRNKLVEFVKMGSNSPPLVELRSAKLKKGATFKNTNLEKMDVICKYVSCVRPDCASPIQPQGCCCQLCGHLLQATLAEQSENSRVFESVSDVLRDKYQARISFDLLWTDRKELQITLAPASGQTGNLNDVVTQVTEDILHKTKSLGVEQIKCSSCDQSISQAGHSRAYIIIFLLIFIVIGIVVAALLIKRFRPELFDQVSISLPDLPTFRFPSVNWIWLRNSFARTRFSDRMEESLVEPSGISSIFTDGIEAIELPDTSHEISFDNPIFSPQIDDSKH